MTDIFYWTLNMSIIGSAMCGIILLLRRIRRIPRFFVYLLWVIPLCRFWIPFGISGKYSLMTLISQYISRTVVLHEAADLPSIVAANFVRAADTYFPIVYKTHLLAAVFQIASFIWIVVGCGALIAIFLLYRFTKAEMRDAILIRDNLYASDRITSPAVYGIIKTRIIVPRGISDEDLAYIELHETAHIARKDNLFRCIALVTACVHWFNPFIWMSLKYYFEDMEMACDAKVLSSLKREEQKQYASALLHASQGKNLFVSAFGGAKIKVRIENILSYKKLTIASTLCFSALLIAIAVLLLTNAQSR